MNRRDFITTTLSAGASLAIPKPISAQIRDKPRDIILLDYYYPWYGKNLRKWRKNKDYLPKRGKYISNDEELLEGHIQEATNYLTDGFAINFHWHNKRYPVDQATRKLISTLNNFPDFTFCLFLDLNVLFDFVRKGEVMPDFLRDEEAFRKITKTLNYLINNYIENTRYKRINGKPILPIYLTRAVNSGLDRILEHARNKLRETTGEDFEIIGDEVFWDNPNLEAHLMELDAITSYNLISPKSLEFASDIKTFSQLCSSLYSQIREKIDESNRITKNKRIDVGILYGYDDTRIRKPGLRLLPSGPPNNPSHYGDIKSAFEILSKNFEIAEEGKALVFGTSFNEWEERSNKESSRKTKDRYGIMSPGMAKLNGIKNAKIEYQLRQTK